MNSLERLHNGTIIASGAILGLVVAYESAERIHHKLEERRVQNKKHLEEARLARQAAEEIDIRSEAGDSGFIPKLEGKEVILMPTLPLGTPLSTPSQIH